MLNASLLQTAVAKIRLTRFRTLDINAMENANTREKAAQSNGQTVFICLDVIVHTALKKLANDEKTLPAAEETTRTSIPYPQTTIATVGK